MNRIVNLLMFLLIFLVGICVSAQAASKSVLLLPYAVNAPDSVQLGKDLTALMRSSLEKQGFRVIVPKNGKTPADVASARSQALAAGATYALYGTFNQIGDSFNLDSRIVDSSSKMARPHYAEGKSLLELAPVVSSVASQLGAAVTNPNGVAAVKVRGLKIIDADRVLVRVQSRVGDPVDLETIDADIRRVWDLGYFSDVSADLEQLPEGETLVFTVVEKPRIDDVRINGSDAVKVEDIIAAMNSRTGTVLNEKMLADDLQVITELYRKKGYYLAEVTYEVVGGNNGTAALVLNVQEGNKLYIRDISIVGLDEELTKEAKKVIKLREKGMFSWFTKSGILKEEDLERDSQAIHSYLIDKGYLDAAVATPEVNYTDEGITVLFKVNQGKRYKLGEVGFRGDLIESPEKFYEITTLDNVKEESEYFSLSAMQNDIKKLTEFYQDYGYAFAQIGADTPMNPEEGIININYSLNPKEKVYIRRVLVEGNDRTRDNVILREMRVADGQQYEGAKIRRSIERLNKLGYFEEVTTELVPTGVPGEVDLKIGIKEGHTGMISIGFGYSTYDKFGVTGSIKEDNLFGRGYSLNLAAYFSGKETALNATFINPRLYNSDLGFMLRAYALEEEWLDYDKRTVGARTGLSYPLGEYTSITGSYRLEFYNLYHIADDASRSIKEYEGDNIGSVVSLSITRDTTDSRTFPTRGTKESITAEYGGNFLGGSDNFFKVFGDYGFYFGLNENNVLHARASAGAVFKNSTKPIPAFERFYIGGMNSLRGFTYEDLSPRDPKTADKIGATHMAYANFEYIWAINKDMGIALVPFFDIGTSVDKTQNPMFDKLYYSTGLEVRWASPMGDLRFAYGFPLTENALGESRSSGRFEFSMGQAF